MPACHNCQTVFADSPSLTGGQFRCPRCGGIVVVGQRAKSNVLMYFFGASMIAVIGVCGLCMIGVLLPASRQQAHRQVAKRQIADEALQLERKKLIDELIAKGLVVEIDAHRFIVNRRLWEELDFDTKESLANLWYAYSFQVPRNGQGRFLDAIRILDSKTNKQVASFSSVSGLQIE